LVSLVLLKIKKVPIVLTVLKKKGFTTDPSFTSFGRDPTYPLIPLCVCVCVCVCVSAAYVHAFVCRGGGVGDPKYDYTYFRLSIGKYTVLFYPSTKVLCK